MRQVVYLDEVIFVNLVMNLTVLWLTSRFTGNRASPARILTAAAVGCIYALILFIPGWMQFASLAYKLPVGALMIVISFGYNGWRKLFRNYITLFLASFFVGGAAIGFNYLFGTMVWTQSLGNLTDFEFNKWFSLSCAVILAVMLGKWGLRWWQRKIHQNLCKIPVKVNLWGKSALVNALVDTGNQLVEPLSQHPVVVIEFEAIKDVLPEEICREVTQATQNDGSKIILSLADTPYANRLRVIPFQSLGKQNGLLLGIRPDSVEIQVGMQEHVVRDVVVGIYANKLSPESTYRALLHPQLLAS